MKRIAFFLFFIVAGHYLLAGRSPLNLDSSVRTGRLENGLTYYVRSNTVPEGRAYFYLVQNVGALLENDHQNSLAHFLEHMAFNGSKHFPGKSMIGMLERHGVSFGKDINAYTALNETIYGLNNVPAENRLIDSCLLILHDWSHFLNLDERAIKAERPVILEEWRTRRDANFRLQAQTTPVSYQGSQYAVRDIIGDTAIIRGISPEEFRKFYHTWYRPDLQAVVVVGDFDADDMEMRIKSLFSAIPMSKGLPERPFFDIPLKKELAFVQATDPEAGHVRIEVRTMQKEVVPADETEGLRMALKTDLFNRLMKTRIAESFRVNKVPALGGGLVRYEEQRGYHSLVLIVGMRPGSEVKALEAALAEKERVTRYGFTDGEMKLEKSALLREIETASAGYLKQPSAAWVEKLSQYFLVQVPVPDPQAYLEFVRRELPLVSSDALVDCMRAWDDGSHCVVTVTGPTKMQSVDVGMVEQALQRVKAMELHPYQDSREENTLLAVQPFGGKIVKEKVLPALGAWEWTLSNGGRVIFRPMDQENQVSLMAYRKGGLSVCAEQDIAAVSALPMLVEHFGAGKLNYVELDRILTPRNVSCGVIVKPWYTGIGGNAPKEEAETLLQMAFLRLEQPRFDSVMHKGIINRLRKQVTEQGNNPFQRINDTLTAMLGNYESRWMPVTDKQLETVSLNQVERLYKELFSGASDFTFLIVGDLDTAVLKPWVEKYIGSISAGKGDARYVDHSPRYSGKEISKEQVLPLSSPRSTVLINYSGKMKYSFEHELYHSVLKEVLEARCMEQLRNKMGATYQVTAQASFEANPVGKYALMVNFDCAPGREKELASQVYALVKELAVEGPTDEDMKKAVKKIQSEYDLSRQTNSFWTNALFFWSLNGVDKSNPNYYHIWLEQITPADLRKYAQSALKSSDRVELTVMPDK